MERPQLVTIAGIAYIVAGATMLVLAAFAFFGAMVAMGVGTAAGGWFGGWVGAIGAFLAMVLMVVALIGAGLGTFVLITGIHVLRGRPWSRVGGIVVGGLLVLVALTMFGEPTSAMGAVLIGAAGVLGIIALMQDETRAWFDAVNGQVPARNAPETA